jgi:hypothetical protein
MATECLFEQSLALESSLECGDFVHKLLTCRKAPCFCRPMNFRTATAASRFAPTLPVVVRDVVPVALSLVSLVITVVLLLPLTGAGST